MTLGKTPPLILTALVTLASLTMPGVSAGVAPASTGRTGSSGARAGSGGLDALTESCLNCHDGIHAPPVAARAAGTPTRYQGHRSLDHPIGMRYRDYPARDPASYRYLLSLDPSIQLVDGKVACVSCHRLKPDYGQPVRHVFATLEGDQRECMASRELARDTQTDSLCLACHVM